MALSKLSPDSKRAEELAQEMKRILDDTMLRDPSLNTAEYERIKQVRAELEEMGLHVTINYGMKLNPLDPLKSTVDTEVNLWLPKNMTIQ